MSPTDEQPERPHTRMAARKRIALVAHDNKKDELMAWVKFNHETLRAHEFYATGSTGKLLADKLGLTVHRMQSGPLGGDQQLGAAIVEGEIDILVFFFDPLEAQPHDPDVRALLRIAAVWNIPVATNRATADFLISSPFMSGEYDRLLDDYYDYLHRLDGRK